MAIIGHDEVISGCQNWGPQMHFLGALVDDHAMAVIMMMILIILTMAIILTLTMMIMVTDMMVTEQPGQWHKTS